MKVYKITEYELIVYVVHNLIEDHKAQSDGGPVVSCSPGKPGTRAEPGGKKRFCRHWSESQDEHTDHIAMESCSDP